MKDMGTHIHNANLKFGLTLGSGLKTCNGYQGSLNNEETDAGSLWNWGVDYLRYGNCYADGVPAYDRYSKMSQALNDTGKMTYHPVNLDMYYAIDNWGDQDVVAWAPSIANSWTTAPKINYLRAQPPVNVWQSLAFNFKQNVIPHVHAGPQHFNDPDHLLIGRQMLTVTEETTQFALWCVAKAPLMISANITTLAPHEQAILSNDFLIAVNQDRLGQQAACAYNCDQDPNLGPVTSYQAQIEETATSGAYIVMVAVNWSDSSPVDLKYDLAANGISFYSWDSCTTQDLWTGVITHGDGGVQDYGSVPAHGHVAKKIKCLPF